MVSFEIEDVKAFMNNFLVKETFDSFLLYELEIHTYVKTSINGNLNRAWFSSDEEEIIGDRQFVLWKEIKPQAFGLIKGSKTPTLIRAVLMLSKSNIEKIIQSTHLDYVMDDVNNLSLNIRYENGKLSIIASTSLNTFKIDKNLEHQWDGIAREMLRKNGIL